jgi:hypothetical protein
MTSKASNLNAGLHRLVWKEGENSTPTDFCATVSSTAQRERRSRFHYLGFNQSSMTHMSIGWGSDLGHLQILCYFIGEFRFQLLAKSRFPIEVACPNRDLMCGAFAVPKDNLFRC